MTDVDDHDRERRFTRLYRDFQPKISAYVRRRLPDSEADDALADTFLTAWRLLGSVPDDPLPWLYRIAANSVANQQRSVRRWSRLRHRVQASGGPNSAGASALPEEASVGWQTGRAAGDDPS